MSLPVITLCGSMRFQNQMLQVAKVLTMEGNVVLTPSIMGFDANDLTAKQHDILDQIHRQKIDLCNYVLVVDVNGYYGANTESEIDYAESIGKEVRYLEGSPDNQRILEAIKRMPETVEKDPEPASVTPRTHISIKPESQDRFNKIAVEVARTYVGDKMHMSRRPGMENWIFKDESLTDLNILTIAPLLIGNIQMGVRYRVDESGWYIGYVVFHPWIGNAKPGEVRVGLPATWTYYGALSVPPTKELTVPDEFVRMYIDTASQTNLEADACDAYDEASAYDYEDEEYDEDDHE